MNVTKHRDMHGIVRSFSGGLQGLLNASFSSLNLDDEFPTSGGSHHSSSREDVSDILDEVEAVISTNDNDFLCSRQSSLPFMEPTPIAPDRARIVDQVQVTENSWHVEHDTFLQVLHPLLSKRKEENTIPLLSKRKEENTIQDTRPTKKRMVANGYQKSVCSSSTGTENLVSKTASISTATKRRFRSYQEEQWMDRYEDLVAFQEKHGHCLTPHVIPSNPALAQWVKRQRYQHKLLMAGKHSTLTKERVTTLEGLGFVWDSHRAAWEERFDELRLFKAKYGHANVPANFHGNPTLAVWVKCQRRQHRLYRKGEPSNMNEERIQKLNSLEFLWNPRERSD